MIEFLFYGVPLLLVAVGIMAFGFDRLRAVWLLFAKGKRQDEAEKSTLPNFERVKTEMFGTKRGKAADKLERDYGRLKTSFGCVFLQIILAVLIWGIVVLWRVFKSQ